MDDVTSLSYVLYEQLTYLLMYNVVPYMTYYTPLVYRGYWNSVGSAPSSF